MKSAKSRQPRGSGRKKTNPRVGWFSSVGGGVGSPTTTCFINSWVMVSKDEGDWPHQTRTHKTLYGVVIVQGYE